MSINLSRLHNDDCIYLYRIEKMKIMRNYNTDFSLISPCVDLFREELDRPDIETSIDLIEEDT